MMTLPNLITLSRCLLSPIFIPVFLCGKASTYIVALLLVVYAEVSDLVDGYIARRYHCVSDMGKLLDPLADSIFHFSVFLSFLAAGYADMWMVLIIFYRNSFIVWLRWVSIIQGKVIAARWIGKFKTALQAVVIIVVLLLIIAGQWLAIPNLALISRVLMGMVAVVTAYSLIDYCRANREVLHYAASALPGSPAN